VEQIEGQEIKSGWIVDEMNTEQWRESFEHKAVCHGARAEKFSTCMLCLTFGNHIIIHKAAG